MKKVFSVLMVAVALMMAAPAQAQLIKFGLKGGMDFTELDFNKKTVGEVTESSTGFFVGPMAEITLPIVGLGSTLGLYVAAGPDFFFNFKDIDVDNMEAKKTQVAMNIGAGLKLLKKLQLGVTYQIPMGDSFEMKDATSVVTAKNKTWQASLAYIF